MAFALFNVGVHIMVWPRAIGESAFHYLIDIVGPTMLAFLYLVVGSSRFFALVANGRWPIWGPRARGAGAIVGAVVWLSMSVALIRYHIPGTPPSPGIPMFFTLFLGELVATYMAASDDRSRLR